MSSRSNTVFGAVALMVGAAVGAGIFGLPYAFTRAGYVVGLMYLVALAAILAFVNLAYGEVVSSTAGTHQFPVYVEKYLGKRWKYMAIVSTFIGFYGALAAYLLEVSHLLSNLIQPYIGGARMTYVLGYAMVMGLALYVGLRAVSNLEKILMVAMLSLIGVLLLGGWPHVNTAHYSTVSAVANYRDIFLPYGIVLFALSCASAVPDMKNILTKQRAKLKTAILIGSAIPLLVYLLFVTMVVGITGPATSESALIGLGDVLGRPVLILGSIFGMITMSTSFLMLGLVLKEIYLYDFHWPPLASWLCVMIPPVLIVLLNWLSFIEILGISGALIGGIDGIIIMKMHRHVQRGQDRQSAFRMTQSGVIHALTYLIFVGGIAYEVYVVAQRLL